MSTYPALLGNISETHLNVTANQSEYMKTYWAETSSATDTAKRCAANMSTSTEPLKLQQKIRLGAVIK